MTRVFSGAPTILVIALAAQCGCDVYDEPARGAADRSVAGRWHGFPESQVEQAPAVRAAGIEYVEGYEAAVARASATRKPILVLFRASWCPWSGEMAGRVLSDTRVVRQSRRFVCVVVDADRERDLCLRHGVRGYPTLLVLGEDGAEIVRRTGRIDADELIALLEKAEPDRSGLATPAVRSVR